MRARDRRALWLGGLAVVVAYTGGRGLPRLTAAASALGQEVEAQAALLQRTRLQLSRRAVLSDSLRLLRDAVGRVSVGLLESRTAAEAMAELTSRITVALSRHPVRLDGVRPVPDSSETVPARAVVVANFEGDVRGLARILSELEGDPRISISRVEVAVANPSVAEGAAEVLRVELEIGGWFVADSSATAGGGTRGSGGADDE